MASTTAINDAPRSPRGDPEADAEGESDDGIVYDEDNDEKIISGIISGTMTAGDDPNAFGFGDTVGKLDDAIDYEDISDDDLPSEGEPSGNHNIRSNEGVGEDGIAGDEFDELFNDIGEEAPITGANAPGGLEDLDGMDLDFMAQEGLVGTSEMDVGQAANADMIIDLDLDLGASAQGSSVEKRATTQELVKKYFPDLDLKARLSFNDLFGPKPQRLAMGPPKPPKVIVPTKLAIVFAPPDETAFSKPYTGRNVAKKVEERPGIITIPQESEDSDESDSEVEEPIDWNSALERNIIMACNDWESKMDIIMGPTPPPTPPREVQEGDDGDEEEINRRPLKRARLASSFLDDLPDSWLADNVVLDGNLAAVANHVTLDLNDPYLLVDIRQPNEIRLTKRIGGEFKRRINKDLTQRYNISNDEAYDLLKGNLQNKVRSAIGQLDIEHSMPALRLQSPYYKTKLSTKEARSFHRPGLHFNVGYEIRFSKIKPRKKKTYRGKDVQSVLKTTKDLSLMDGCNFILLEYSEEYPFVMSNFGMGSRLINYYRRKGPDDESRPKCEIGETQVLMSQDRSPFWNFGTVDPGETVPTLYNNMVRAPIFKQNPRPTDFLVIRNTQANQSHYYLRNIPNLFVVGQLLPVTDVPGPHSRKVTTAAKNRLKMVCYRVVKRKPEKAIILKDIAEHFPENNEMRQKMKEFMSYNKPKGVWEMNAGEVVPDESVIRTMVKPEDLCLLEAMQVGVRHLADSGYSKTVDDEVEDDDKEGMSLEQQLTPWVSTKNFINATSGKAMLQLHGEGDPSGRGEAFSFVKTSMKGGYKPVGESVEEKMDKQRLKELGGHAYNVARQQQMYEAAIDQIWRAQHRSLSSQVEPEMPDNEFEDAHNDHHEDLEEGRTPRSEAIPPSPWLNNVDVDETMSQFSRFSATNRRNKVLKIQRKFRGSNGEVETRSEIIRDPKVIRQYLQRRRELDAEKTQVENLVPTGNEDEDQQSRKRLVQELKRLERNKERREARERDKGKRVGSFANDAMSPESIATPGSPMPSVSMQSIATPTAAGVGAGASSSSNSKTATVRKCKNCGQVGHIRTNKKVCPKLNGQWAELGMSPPDGNTPVPTGTPGS
ncbi:hypothetical protein L873DRAFT_1828286 [Choiromyces venosus 120613-1]|uniref:Transcription initiation factor TFIID subunit 1 histone acetyltransferase domain-containing protein n=1 Tax=Choiromyces venosus 120613-1 TaxID=1336337 RepID=A0A3N4JKX8_9PEZI|nr:hypothetical protein L873DRAFT_1828286 [Choiromyces venosus 120613-1]